MVAVGWSQRSSWYTHAFDVMRNTGGGEWFTTGPGPVYHVSHLFQKPPQPVLVQFFRSGMPRATWGRTRRPYLGPLTAKQARRFKLESIADARPSSKEFTGKYLRARAEYIKNDKFYKRQRVIKDAAARERRDRAALLAGGEAQLTQTAEPEIAAPSSPMATTDDASAPVAGRTRGRSAAAAESAFQKTANE